MSHPAQFRNGVKISERHGAGEWTLEKLCLAALMPLGVWVASTAFTLTGASYDTVVAWFASKLNAGLAIATTLIFFLFAALAWKVIVEDYIHKPGNKIALLLLNAAFCWLVGALGVFSILKIALLGAGA